MKVKSDIEFISFSDGICNIYTEYDNGQKKNKYAALGFNKRVLGYKKYLAASANQMQINRVIRIPMLKNIDTYDSVEIKDEGKYNIKFLQEIYDTNPPCIDLTLQVV